jgi:hypothetical protein
VIYNNLNLCDGIKTDESDINDVSDEEETTTEASAHGVFFSVEHNTWMSAASCCQQVIPEELPQEASQFVLRRETCRDVETEISSDGEHVPRISEHGFMIGTDCVPQLDDSTCSCGIPWSTSSLQNCGTFVLRTYIGAVMRQKRKAVCIQCGEEKHWDPAAEYIHTIDDGNEGGEKCLYYLSNVCIMYSK